MRMTCGALLLTFSVAGCDAPSAPTPPAQRVPPAAARSVHPIPQTASLSGRVVWSGAVPHADPVTSYRGRPDGQVISIVRPAPNVPAIGPEGGVTGAVVFLRGIDPNTARGWDHPPVTVELHDERPMIRQGDGPPGSIGFVRRGDEITVASRQTLFHSLRARGAAFWTVTLPDPDRPRTRRLDQPGVVELSSGANYFWMRGYLWVCDHPYYAVTDAAGHWELTGVPAGEYDLVAWLPEWRTERQERDPETGLISRYVFKPPLQVARRVSVRETESASVGDLLFNP
jgi:hypothetical protein